MIEFSEYLIMTHSMLNVNGSDTIIVLKKIVHGRLVHLIKKKILFANTHVMRDSCIV